MKKIIYLSILFCLSAGFCDAQKIVKIEKPTESNVPLTKISTEISDTEWQVVNDSVQAENWGKSSELSLQILNRVKNDNEKKQLAQIRYIYLYSLAGKVIAYSEAHNKPLEDAARKELNDAAEGFVGKEMMMPARLFLANCSKKLNYICPVKNNDNALRVTATNKEGTAIHSFESILFDQKIDLKEFAGKEIFLGGTLAKVEFNDTQSNLWITRLALVKGFVRVVVDK